MSRTDGREITKTFIKDMNCSSDLSDNRGDFGWLVALIILVLFLCLQSCKTTKYVPVETVRTDSIRITQIQRDSIHVTDSVYIIQRSDTVFREHWNTVYKEVSRGDTAYIERIDTISVPYPVEAQLTSWQTTRIRLGEVLLVVLVLGIIAAVVWLIYKKIKK